MLTVSRQPQSFFATKDFTSAWRVYRQWVDFQTTLGRQHEVRLAGCRINGQNCWEVLISQDLHDERLKHLQLTP